MSLKSVLLASFAVLGVASAILPAVASAQGVYLSVRTGRGDHRDYGYDRDHPRYAYRSALGIIFDRDGWYDDFGYWHQRDGRWYDGDHWRDGRDYGWRGDRDDWGRRDHDDWGRRDRDRHDRDHYDRDHYDRDHHDRDDHRDRR